MEWGSLKLICVVIVNQLKTEFKNNNIVISIVIILIVISNKQILQNVNYKHARVEAPTESQLSEFGS